MTQDEIKGKRHGSMNSPGVAKPRPPRPPAFAPNGLGFAAAPNAIPPTGAAKAAPPPKGFAFAAPPPNALPAGTPKAVGFAAPKAFAAGAVPNPPPPKAKGVVVAAAPPNAFACPPTAPKAFPGGFAPPIEAANGLAFSFAFCAWKAPAVNVAAALKAMAESTVLQLTCPTSVLGVGVGWQPHVV